ncbi:MAG: 30S ribosome-binding factor RbfA [Gammaproteobacteria bacterium]|nr:MAG: 30S ribosome-binding factor RbfA [Gammaproteobacteria bacterium]RLA54106.1 MAG: 30S ribosome-binding factor RbfA [Gammaproteobacteria bacterium]
MPREFSRSDRVADAVQRELADMIRQELRDPRLSMINVTGVDVSRDITAAKVFVNFIEELDDDEHTLRIAVLNKAAGFLRSLLMRRMRLRVTPRLTFFYDDTGDRGRHLSALIDYAVAQDHQSDAEGEDK